MEKNEFLLHLICDISLRERFKKDPKKVLQEENISYSDPREIKVCEEKPGKTCIVIRQACEFDEIMLNKMPLSEKQKLFYKQLYQSEELRNKLKKEPHAVLKNFEINIDPTDQIEVLENTDKVNFWVLPPLQEIPDELLAKISGGGHNFPSISALDYATFLGGMPFPNDGFGSFGTSTLPSSKPLLDPSYFDKKNRSG